MKFVANGSVKPGHVSYSKKELSDSDRILSEVQHELWLESPPDVEHGTAEAVAVSETKGKFITFQRPKGPLEGFQGMVLSIRAPSDATLIAFHAKFWKKTRNGT